MVDRAIRQAERLSYSLDRLAGSGLVTATVTPNDLHILIDELGIGQQGPELERLRTKAKALVTVLEDGMVEGDLERVRAALVRAEGLARSTIRRSGSGERRRGAAPIAMSGLEGRTFTHRTKDGERKLTVIGGKWILDDGGEYASPTAAARAVVGNTSAGKKPSVNGRRFWRIPS